MNNYVVFTFLAPVPDPTLKDWDRKGVLPWLNPPPSPDPRPPIPPKGSSLSNPSMPSVLKNWFPPIPGMLKKFSNGLEVPKN